MMLLSFAIVQTQLPSSMLVWETKSAYTNGSRTFLESWEGFTDRTDFCVAMPRQMWSLIQVVYVIVNRLCTFCQGSREIPEKKKLDPTISIILYFI